MGLSPEVSLTELTGLTPRGGLTIARGFTDLGASRGYETGIFTFTVPANALSIHRNAFLHASYGAFTVTGESVTLYSGPHVSLPSAAFTFTGSAVALERSLRVNLAQGISTLTGGAITLRRSLRANLAQGTFALTGEDLTVQRGPQMPVTGGVFTLTGGDLTLRRSLRAGLAQGISTFTGEALEAYKGRPVSLAQGVFTATGESLTFTRGLRAGLAQGVFTLTGGSSTLQRGLRVSLAQGVSTLTGEALSAYKGQNAPLSAGTFTLTGSALTLRRGLRASIGYGTATFTGEAATLTPSGGSSYPGDSLVGAAIAYSTRRLFTAYSGPAIRVVRSSDATETDIGFDGDGDLDTSALLTFVGSGDGSIVTWYDQTGNGRHSTATVTAKARVVISGTLQTTTNGRAAAVSVFNARCAGTMPVAINSADAECFSVYSNQSIGYARFLTLAPASGTDWGASGGWVAINTGSAGNDRRSYAYSSKETSPAITCGTSVLKAFYSKRTGGVLYCSDGVTTATSSSGAPDISATRVLVGTDNTSNSGPQGLLCEAVLTTSIQSDYTTFLNNQNTYWTT
jgi:hypothetical protein